MAWRAARPGMSLQYALVPWGPVAIHGEKTRELPQRRGAETVPDRVGSHRRQLLRQGRHDEKEDNGDGARGRAGPRGNPGKAAPRQTHLPVQLGSHRPKRLHHARVIDDQSRRGAVEAEPYGLAVARQLREHNAFGGPVRKHGPVRGENENGRLRDGEGDTLRPGGHAVVVFRRVPHRRSETAHVEDIRKPFTVAGQGRHGLRRAFQGLGLRKHQCLADGP